MLAGPPTSEWPTRARWVLCAGLGILAAINLVFAGLHITLVLTGSDALDWHTYREAVSRVGTEMLYAGDEWWYGWRYSPVATLLFLPVAWMGESAWRLLHILALIALPGWSRWIALASYPFWFDVSSGNVMTFVLVAAFWAVRGNRLGIGATLVMALLIPRPMMLPIVAWILWRHPPWRMAFVLLLVVHTAAVLATGYGDDWVRVLQGAPGEMTSTVNLAPSAMIGPWWMVAAVPLTLWTFARGYPATSGLLLQPYWLPYYLLIPLADRWPRFSPRLPLGATRLGRFRFRSRGCREHSHNANDEQ